MAVTPNYSWPVPVNTDYVKDGAEAIKDLGDAIDSTVFGLPSGASGLTLVKTQTIGSAVSSVTVSGAFSATYDAYRILVTGGVASAGTYLTLKIGAAATAYYGNLIYANYGYGAPASNGNSNTALWSGGVGGADTSSLNASIQLNSPFLTEKTMVLASFYDVDNAGVYTGWLGNTTSYTDFTLAVAAGTMTGGTIRVYGYQN